MFRTTRTTIVVDDAKHAVLAHRVQRAAKDHTCTACNGRVWKGQDYYVSFLVQWGKAVHYKQHLDCTVVDV